MWCSIYFVSTCLFTCLFCSYLWPVLGVGVLSSHPPWLTDSASVLHTSSFTYMYIYIVHLRGGIVPGGGGMIVIVTTCNISIYPVQQNIWPVLNNSLSVYVLHIVHCICKWKVHAYWSKRLVHTSYVLPSLLSQAVLFSLFPFLSFMLVCYTHIFHVYIYLMEDHLLLTKNLTYMYLFIPCMWCVCVCVCVCVWVKRILQTTSLFAIS